MTGLRDGFYVLNLRSEWRVVNHRDTEGTEDAQSSTLRAPSVSSVSLWLTALHPTLK